MQERAIVLLPIVIGRREPGRLCRAVARLDGAQLGGLGFSHGGFDGLGCWRWRGLFGATGACKLIRSLGNLCFQIFHGRRDVEVSRLCGEIEIESLFKLLGDLGIKILRRGGFLRHAFATLY